MIKNWQNPVLAITGVLLYCLTAAAAPQKVTSLLYPVEHSDVSLRDSILTGANSVRLETKKSDLEINIWFHDKKYSMEVIVDVTDVNQSLLPVDSSGKLIEKSTHMSAIPWVKVYWPGLGPVTLDVKCDNRTKKCTSIWANFPYDPSKDSTFKIEANLRGLEGKLWTPRLNIHGLYSGQASELGIITRVFNPLYAIQPGAKAAQIRVRQHYDLSRLPSVIRPYSLLRILEWSFQTSSQMGESGFFRTLNPTLFTLDEGSALLQTLADKSLQTFEMNRGDTFWAPTPTVLSFATKQNKNAESALFRLLEFRKK